MSIPFQFGDDLADNAELVRRMLRGSRPLLQREEDAAKWVSSFSIAADGRKPVVTVVEAGKYKSALFLWWLIEYNHRQTNLRITEEHREFVRRYFTTAICKDAVENPETKHTTVRALLTGKDVTVYIVRKLPIEGEK